MSDDSFYSYFNIGENSLLKKLKYDNIYKLYLEEAKGESKRRTEQMVAQLQTVLSQFSQNPQNSFLVRGSHARKDSTRESDIDVALITQNPNYEICVKWRNSIQNVMPMGSSISVIGLDPRFPLKARSFMFFWTTILMGEFIFGSLTTIKEIRLNMLNVLRSLKANDLLELYSRDTELIGYTVWKLGPIGRGYGGIVDYEFAELMREWFKVTQYNVSKTENDIFLEIKKLYEFLTVIRNCCVEKNNNKWFCDDEQITKARIALKVRIEALFSLIL
jgi:predicted nucleotidyltransferase